MSRTKWNASDGPQSGAWLCVIMMMSAYGSVGFAVADPPKAKRGDWPMWGGSVDRNMVSDETGIPTEWDARTRKNIKWVAPLGSQTYGNPVIAQGKVFVGTNNNGELRPTIKGDKGVVVCVDEKSGQFLWQATHDKLPTGQVNDWPEQGICSAPCVVGDRLYYVSNRCELVCADTEGFLDGENDGPVKDEKYGEKEDGDVVWSLDMIEELGVFPHNLATSSPFVVGDLVYVITSNGVDEGHLNLPSPAAPAFIGVNRNTGEVVWTRNDPGKNTLHGQWSSPSYGVVKGQPQAYFAGGDGWLYAIEPLKGELVWKYNMNPPDSKYVLGGRGTKSYIIATPVFFDNKVFLCVGQDPEHGEGVGQFHCIDATKSGDVTGSARIWSHGGNDFHRSLSTAAVRDGLVYAADLSGFLYCFDLKTGERLWRADLEAAIWGSPYVVDGKVMIGNEDGDVHVFKHGRTMEKLAVNNMESSVYTTPVAANGVLYITNRRALYAIEDAARKRDAK